jgi:hypothetical protein
MSRLACLEFSPPLRNLSEDTAMLKTCWIIMCVLSFASVASAQFSPGNPMSGLERLKNFESQRASSSDPNWKNGNGDCRPIKVGESLTIADLEGPGVIAHIWITISHRAENYSRLLTLRMYWDGEEHPSVECPIGDFFGVGHGVDRTFDSLPIRVSSLGRGRNCYWPMPFRKSAKITVTNESNLPCDAFFYYVDWQKHPSLPDDTAYFHAMYRQEFPCVMGRNYLLADIVGRGHYVGTVQSVVNISDGWYGEGDDFFFIDGEKEPRLRGTGTEDYFCDGWGFYAQQGPFYGVAMPDWGKAGDMTSVYRFHVPDPVAFKKSLRVEIEHKGSQDFPGGGGTGFIERDDLMSSVAYWYQAEPHKRWPALPAGRDRLPWRTKNLVVGWKSASAAKHSEAPLEEQPLGGATGGKQLFFQPAQQNPAPWLEIPFTVEKESIGSLRLRGCHAADYGVYRVLLDGREIGRVDLYSREIRFGEEKLGWQELSAGDHSLRFESAGKNAKSTGIFLGIDALTMQSPVYARSEKVDLRTLQKKK